MRSRQRWDIGMFVFWIAVATFWTIKGDHLEATILIAVNYWGFPWPERRHPHYLDGQAERSDGGQDG